MPETIRLCVCVMIDMDFSYTGSATGGEVNHEDRGCLSSVLCKVALQRVPPMLGGESPYCVVFAWEDRPAVTVPRHRGRQRDILVT